MFYMFSLGHTVDSRLRGNDMISTAFAGMAANSRLSGHQKLFSICSGLLYFIQNCHPEFIEGSNFDHVHGFLRQAQDKQAHHDIQMV
jgi:hypothetical protein